MAAEDRLHGSRGQILMNPLGTAGVGALPVASLNKWDLSLDKDQVKVTCFGDTNQVYVEGLPDIKGTYGGFYDPADGLVIFDVIFGTVKPYLGLVPSSLTPDVLFGGKANLSGKISVDANGAITIGGGITAAGAWTLPSAA
jgi:hypothetical protein